MIDNFDKIQALLSFSNSDDFYFAQILKRKKEHPELGSNSYVVKTYYIKSIEDFSFYKEEMICLADFHNARVGINLNKRSFEKTAFNTLKKVTDQIMNKDYKSVRAAYNSVCGDVNNETDKKWIVDVDKGNFDLEGRLNYVLKVINDLHLEINDQNYKVLAVLPTKNGYHIITNPFNLQKFSLIIADIEVHKNNPTILYIP